jgi:ferredoxin
VYPAFGKGCIQAGHFIAGRRNAILFEETCVHGQCYTCNVTLKGMGVEYFLFMEKRYGRDEIDRLVTLSKQTKKLTALDLLEIEANYKEKIKWLKTL